MVTTAQVVAWAEARPWPTDAIRPTWAGLAPSEILAMWAVLHGMGVQHVVESGRHEGTSTEALALAGFEVDSVDVAPCRSADDRLAAIDGVRLHTGDGDAWLPKLIRRGSGVLIDGPKRRKAVALARRCIRRGARVAFLHDFHRRNPARSAVTGWHTDTGEWTEYAGHLDGPYWDVVRAHGGVWKNGPHTAGAGSYGPTLMVLT
jgi:hypothetical protein